MFYTLATLLEQSGSKAKLLRSSSSLIQDIHYDSRRITQGSLFCVLAGTRSHGKHYIQDAIMHGAKAILIEDSMLSDLPSLPDSFGIACVSDEAIRKELSLLSKQFFLGQGPEPALIGITGTDGKTSTVQYIHQLATKLGIVSAYWSTINYHDGLNLHDNSYRQSTPESSDIFRFLASCVRNNCNLAILEATSHGLSHKNARMIDLQFSFAGLTNIGHEHLDFHKSIEQYAKDKSNLFSQLKPDSSYGFLRYEEPNRELFCTASEISAAKILTYSQTREEADYFYRSLGYGIGLSRGLLQLKKDKAVFPITIGAIASYTIDNVLLALAIMHNYAKEVDIQELCTYASTLQSIEGRLQTIVHEDPFTAIVDYAHTPNSFQAILSHIRKHATQKLIVVFGSAGDRDKAKRPQLGAIADNYADILVLCDEDPRSEDPKNIIKEIAQGCKVHTSVEELFLIPNREEAISHALSLAKKDDFILFLGKGHEKTIEYANHSIDWNEAEQVRKHLP